MGVMAPTADSDRSRPTPPFPLVEGETVRLDVTVDAIVYDLPDPESDPTQQDYLWSFAYMAGGARVIESLSQDEVIARVRKELSL